MKKGNRCKRMAEKLAAFLTGLCFLFLWNTSALSQEPKKEEKHEHKEGEKHGLKSVDRPIYAGVDIPGSEDFHPGDTHGGVAWKDAKDVILLYLRAPGGYASKPARAQEAAKELNEMFLIGHAPDFEVVHEKGETSIVVEPESEHPHHVVTVTRGDVLGYQYRAPGGKYNDAAATSGLRLKEANEINAEMVAKWWAANLEDQIAMFLGSEEAHHTKGTFAGETYESLYKKARSQFPSGEIELEQWIQVINALTPEEKRQLKMVGQFIPEDFGGAHEAEAHEKH